MNRTSSLPALIERFFTERLIRQQHASPHTVASYRDTFRLLLGFASDQRRKPPSDLELPEIDAPLISAFLEHLQTQRATSTRTRNLRLTAIRSFFRFVAFEEPAYSAHIQRILAIPSKRGDKKLIHFLNRPEIEALLGTPDRTTWLGRRDHALLSLAIQTGLRLSELTSLDRELLAGMQNRVILGLRGGFGVSDIGIVCEDSARGRERSGSERRVVARRAWRLRRAGGRELVGAVDEQSAVVTLDGLGELVEEGDECFGVLGAESKGQADDRQVIGFHG